MHIAEDTEADPGRHPGSAREQESESESKESYWKAFYQTGEKWPQEAF